MISQKEEDLHRQIPTDIVLDEVLCFEEKRQVQNDWTVSWRSRIFQISKQDRGLGLAKQYITVREKLDDTLQLEHRGRLLKFKEIKERPKKISAPTKPSSHSRRTRMPAPDHPWKNCSTRSSPQSRLDSDERGGAHSRRGAPMDNSSRVDSVQPN